MRNTAFILVYSSVAFSFVNDGLQVTSAKENSLIISWQFKSSGLWGTAMSTNVFPLLISTIHQTNVGASLSFSFQDTLMRKSVSFHLAPFAKKIVGKKILHCRIKEDDS